MDFHAAMETFAEAWVAANTQTAVNTEGQVTKPTPIEDLPTQLPRDQLVVAKTTTPTPLPPAPPQHSPSSTSIRSLPIHCIIEQTSGQPSFDASQNEKSSTHNSVELDTYAILPGTTLLSECVRAALVKLGYQSAETLGAKGAIQIKNWKPLSFETITDDKAATIDDILGELTQVSTLRIRICSATKLNSADEVKEKLLQLLLNQSHSLLANAGCSGEKGYTNGQTLATISPEMRRAFDRWYEEQLKAYTESSNSRPGGMNLTLAAKELLAMQQERMNMVMAAAHRDGRLIPDKIKCSSPQISPPVHRPMAASTPTEAIPSTHPAFQPHYLPGKTRMRTSFDPEHEIPRLQKWFADNQHPSREQMLQYLDELNSLDSRKGRRPLDLTNIIYWFKNARAAHRRATKNSEDDSFEMEEEKESTTGSNENLPFLPNRNAVYMVPYPHFPNMGINSNLGLIGAHSRFNGHHDYREPCDLSVNKRSRSELTKSVSPSEGSPNNTKDLPRLSTEENSTLNISDHNDTTSPVLHEAEETDNRQTNSDEKSQEKLENSEAVNESSEQEEFEKVPEDLSVKEDSSQDENEPKDFTVENLKPIQVDQMENDNQAKDLSREKSHEEFYIKSEEEPSDLSVSRRIERPYDYTQMRPTDLTNGNKRKYESEDDMDSDDDDVGSLDRSSVSSHDDNKITSLRESYLNAARGLNFNPVSSSPSGQPLHIPQFPHPLAMHYFPLNTHLYSQQANQMKLHNHLSHVQPTPPKSPTGHGQENSSHRKRRTRVFIDPLSEIPKLEKWFLDDTHPSSYMIDKYCEELNSSEYRQKFPKLEPKNVQLWFKNHRAKWRNKSNTSKAASISEVTYKGTTIWTDEMVRNAVIGLLKEMNQPMLSRLSPLSQSAISNIANWKYGATLSSDKCKKFGEWYKKYKTEKNKSKDMPFDTTKDNRLTFHPELEIPMLRQWYGLNKNPSDEKLYFYANELNKGCVRQERSLVTVAKLKNWWKNEKQREKRMSMQSERKNSSEFTSSSDVSDSGISQRTRSEKRLKVERHFGRESDTEPIQSTETGPNRDIKGSEREKCNQEELSMEGNSHVYQSRADNVPHSGEYSSHSGGYNPQPGMASLFHCSEPIDNENGKHVILSDGTVVRAESLLSPALVRTGNQGQLAPVRHNVHASQSGVGREDTWN